MKRILFLLLSMAIAIYGTQVNAAEINDKPIEIIVPFPPGGATDSLGRIAAEILTEAGRPAVVINKPGADAVIGANYAAKARPDGRTLFVGATGALDANIAFRAPGIEYTEKSFVPIVPLTNLSYVLAVPASSPIKTYEEFKAYVRANPNRFDLAFWNANTANIFYDWARRENLPKPNIILYKGSGPQVVDLVGGHIPFAWDTWFAIAPQFKADKVRVIATLTKEGSAVIKKIKPDNPSIDISSLHPELNVGVWYGLWAPAGTPKSQIDEINAIINRAFKEAKYQEKSEAIDIRLAGGTAEILEILQKRNLRILRRIAQNLDK